LLGHPVVSPALIRDRYSVAFNTAQRSVQFLQPAGILREVTEQRRDRLWVAHEIMDVLTGRRRRPSAMTVGEG
jgi:ribosomal protein S25